MENALVLRNKRIASQEPKFGSLDNSVFRNTLMFVHIVAGFITIQLPIFVTIWSLVFAFYAVIEILRTRNRNNFAVYASAYYCALELVTRALESPLPWEFGKYMTVGFLVLGMIVEKRKIIPARFALLYFVLMLPSIAIAEYENLHRARYLISFNLSGPLSLAVSWIYFYKRQFTKKEFSRIIFWFILPVCMMLAIIIIKLPNMANVSMNLQSKKEFSGGFGPNQVAVIMGFSFFIMVLALLLDIRVSGLKFIDIGFGIICLAEGLLTFSRGGVVTGVFCALVAFYVSARNGKTVKQLPRMLGLLVVLSIVGYIGWKAVDNATGHFLTARYEKALGEGARTDEVSKERGYDLSGRDDIFFSDLKIFANNPIAGVGPGCAIVERQKMLGYSIIAHTELSRVLAEHGMYGVGALLILIVVPFYTYRYTKKENRVLLSSFTLFSIVTMLHAAMRLGIIGFAFGLGFIILSDGASHALQRANNE